MAETSNSIFVVGILYLLFIGFFLFCWGKIFRKAGYSGWMGLLFIIPLVNLGVFIWFAFADWPVAQKRMNPDTFN